MTHASRAEFRAQLLARIPRWYVPAAHLALPAAAGLAIAAFALSRIEDLRAWQIALVPAFLAFGNAIEWHAHKGILHRRMRFLHILYLRHTPQHHALYVPDAMAIHSARELRFILLPGYGILAILAATSPLVLFFFWVGQPNLAALWVASAVIYLLCYEWLHLAYHLPESSFVGRLPPVQRLRRHHQMHHAPQLMQHWNFNVTVPLWDHVRGTVYSAPVPAAPPEAVPVRRTP
ncbi:MAG TPA: sterol desaturase family protein [Anaeromyxobacter sp.]|nr:sterol desaturase family protein [Anaeromyxobacter sp.]